MNHQQRVAACHKVSDALLEKYRDEIIATAAIGSVARGEDLEHSDVDFHAVVKDGSSLSSHVFMLNRCLFGVHVRTESSWIREPEEPNRNFPVVIGSLESMMVIHDPSGVFGRLRERARNIPDERWKDAVRGGLEGICEDLSRLKKYHAEEDWINFRLWSPFL
ncbi:MAG: nucleotidyltransferase domain-containing protein, partial [Thermoplasmata archaeon]